MSGRWFRLYASIRHDPKVQRLPLKARWALLMMWTLASENDGVIPEAHLDYELGMRPCHVKEVVNLLMGLTLLERIGDKLVPHNWRGRQYLSDNSTERSKAFRKKQRCRDVAATPPETETETETEQIDSSGAKAPTPAKRAHRLPEDWQPRKEDFDKLFSEGFSLSEIQDQVPRFRDYWRGNGRAMVDWFATFRNWVRKSAEIGQGRGGPRAQSPPKRNVFMDLGTEALNKFEERENAEQVAGYIEDRRTQERG
jgi:hypothetical protein